MSHSDVWSKSVFNQLTRSYNLFCTLYAHLQKRTKISFLSTYIFVFGSIYVIDCVTLQKRDAHHGFYTNFVTFSRFTINTIFLLHVKEPTNRKFWKSSWWLYFRIEIAFFLLLSLFVLYLGKREQKIKKERKGREKFKAAR